MNLKNTLESLIALCQSFESRFYRSFGNISEQYYENYISTGKELLQELSDSDIDFISNSLDTRTKEAILSLVGRILESDPNYKVPNKILYL